MTERSRDGRGRLIAAAGAVAVLTLALRLPVLLESGGLLSAVTVDDGVHYAAAASLLAGRAPYRDFLFLHPPGILLALLPFAGLGRLVGDAHAFAAARATFIAIGAGSTGLAVVSLRRFGLGPALVGAGVLACSYPVVFAERSALLEPLGAAGLLGALALQTGGRGRGARIAAGALLGLVAVVKLPFVVPALVVALAVRRGAGGVLVAAVITAGAVCLPFLVLAGGAMVRQVLLDQAGRRRIVPSAGLRLEQMFPAPPGLPEQAAVLSAVAVAVVLLVVGLVTPGARRFAAMLAAGVVELLAAPSFYGHYAILAALPAALLCGVLTARVGARGRGRRRSAGLATAAAAVALAAAASAWSPARIALLTTPPIEPPLAAALRSVRGCITADTATTLVLSGTLTRQLEQGCPLRPDVTGWQFETRGAGGSIRPDRSAAYQAAAAAYFRSGAAVVLVSTKDGLTARTRAAVLTGPVLWSGARGSARLIERGRRSGRRRSGRRRADAGPAGASHAPPRSERPGGGVVRNAR